MARRRQVFEERTVDVPKSSRLGLRQITGNRKIGEDCQNRSCLPSLPETTLTYTSKGILFSFEDVLACPE